eukprot:COSAG01_NODE_273_length_19739_cov_90.981925_5_plen_51_part_00
MSDWYSHLHGIRRPLQVTVTNILAIDALAATCGSASAASGLLEDVIDRSS